MLSKSDCIHRLWGSAVIFRRPRLQMNLWLRKKVVIVIMKPILKGYMEITLIVRCSNITTRHNIVRVRVRVPKKSPEESEPQYHVQVNSENHNIGLILILTVLKTILLQGSLIFSKYYTLNVFKVKRIRIGFQFMFHLFVNFLQVVFNLIQTPLSWRTINITKTVVVSVVYLLLWKCQTNCLLQMQSQAISLPL